MLVSCASVLLELQGALDLRSGLVLFPLFIALQQGVQT
jgi:hypothetical protein